MQRLLDEIGLNGRRIQMINLSAAMAGQFTWAAAEMTAEVKRMEPNPLPTGCCPIGVVRRILKKVGS